MGKLRILETYKSTLQMFIANAAFPLPSAPSTQQRFFSFPYSQVSRFVGRQRILSEFTEYLEEARDLQSTCKTAVLHGMGGQGKTQIALEYCRRAQNSGAFAFICWIDASSESALIRSFGTATEKLTKNSVAFPDNNSRVSYLREFLRRSNDRWALVFDNYDRPDGFRNIASYFPPCHNGVLIITTRHAEVVRLGKGIAVDGMKENEAVELFLERCRLETTRDDQAQAAAVVKCLGYLPLAIDQAGSYVSSRRIPLESFQEHYDRRKDVILKHTPLLWDYHKKVSNDQITSLMTTFTTWEMSLQQISPDVDADSIVHFLTLSAFLDSRSVGQSLFSAFLTWLPQDAHWTSIFLTQNQWDEFKYQDLLALLRGLSLIQDIQFRSREAHFSLHPLVKEWLRLRCPSADSTGYYQEAMQLVSVSIENSYEDETSFEVRSNLVAHADACMTDQNQTLTSASGLKSQLLEDITNSFASLYNSHGRYDDAGALYSLLLRSQERTGKTERWQTAMNLANTMRNLGRYELAAEVTRKVFEERKEYLGSSHLDTLRALEGLALTHCLQEKYDQASEEYQHILKEREAQLGISDLETVRALECVANCLRYKCQYSEAEAFYGWAMQIRARVEEHPGICAYSCMEGLAIIYRHQARLDEAIHLYRLVLHYFRTVLGACHPQFVQTILNLSIAYIHAEKIDVAGNMAEQALEGFRCLFGLDHPDTKRAAEQVARIQTMKINMSNRSLPHHGLQMQQQQRAPCFELTESRRTNPQWELSSLKRSIIQDGFGMDSMSMVPQKLFKVERGKYQHRFASTGQTYNDTKKTMHEGRNNRWKHNDLFQTLSVPDIGKTGPIISPNVSGVGSGPPLPLMDEEGRQQVQAAVSNSNFGHQLIMNSLKRSQKNIMDLFTACGAEYGAFIDFLLAHYQLGPDMKDYVGNTQLSRAAKHGHVNVVTYLLSRRDVAADSRNRQSCTPLMLACQSNHIEVMRLFLHRDDVDVNTRDSHGQTPLIHMAKSNQAEAFKVLLESKSVDINAQDNTGQTSLKWRAEHGNEELVCILLDMGAQHKKTTDGYNITPLSQAVVRRHFNIVNLIALQGIANPEKTNQAFLVAVQRADTNIARLLLDTGIVDINRKYRFWGTPLTIAAAGHQTATITLLLERGADPSIANAEGRTPLNESCKQGSTSIVKLLLDHSTAQIDVVDNHGKSPLHYAVEFGFQWTVRLLLNAGAKIDMERLEASRPKWVETGGREALLNLVREAFKERQEQT